MYHQRRQLALMKGNHSALRIPSSSAKEAFPTMTALMTRLRPSSSRGLRVRLSHRRARSVSSAAAPYSEAPYSEAPSSEATERLATRTEIELLWAGYQLRPTRGDAARPPLPDKTPTVTDAQFLAAQPIRPTARAGPTHRHG